MGLVSSKTVIERFYSEYPFEWELNHSLAVEWIVGELLKIKSKLAFAEYITNGENSNPDPLKVTSHKVKLPTNCYKVLHVRDYDSKTPLIKATDSFHPYTSQHYDMGDYVYKIKDGYITTGVEEITLEIVYLGLYVDDEGFPMIVDNEDLLECLTLTIADKIAKRLYTSDKLSRDKYAEINRDHLLYRKIASTSLEPISEYFETAKNIILRLIPIRHEFETSFYNLGKDR